MDSWDKIIEHRQRRQLRLDEKEIMKSSYPIKANYLIKNGILTEKMVCCLDDGVLDMFLKKHFRQDSYIKRMIEEDADTNDIDWITVENGEHVPLDGGKAIGGPLKGRDFSNAVSTKKSNSKGENSYKGYGTEKEDTPQISSSMKPKNEYIFEEGMSEDDFIEQNIEALRDIYDEQGSEALTDEYFKTCMENSSKNIHQMDIDKAKEVFYDNIKQSDYDGWYRNADSGYKPRLVYGMLKNTDTRNAGLSMAYENYKWTGGNLSFEEFLITPIKMYRGGHGQKHIEDDVFSAYTFDKEIAEKFAGKNGKITEAKIRPIDTFGSMRTAGNELEIWVPRTIAPNGRTDSNYDSE